MQVEADKTAQAKAAGEAETEKVEAETEAAAAPTRPARGAERDNTSVAAAEDPLEVEKGVRDAKQIFMRGSNAWKHGPGRHLGEVDKHPIEA